MRSDRQALACLSKILVLVALHVVMASTSADVVWKCFCLVLLSVALIMHYNLAALTSLLELMMAQIRGVKMGTGLSSEIDDPDYPPALPSGDSAEILSLFILILLHHLNTAEELLERPGFWDRQELYC